MTPAPSNVRSRRAFLTSATLAVATATASLGLPITSRAASKTSSRTRKSGPGARILKVLPHFLDLKGRHTVNPSLFDRDAYQFELRRNPELRSGMRMDILWKGLRGTPSAVLNLQVELRGSTAHAQNPVVLRQRVFASSDFSQWTRIPVLGEDYERLGDLVSWRVSLWNGDEAVAEQTSFLW